MKHMKKTLISVVLILIMTIMPVGEAGVNVTARAETMVYVTRTGSKYHSHKCGNGNYYQQSLSEAKARGLTPCSKCYSGSSASSTGTSSGNSSGSSSASSGSSVSSAKSKLSISSTKLTLVKGGTKKLTVKGGSGTAKWSSSNTKVAVVSSSGKVTAKGKGKATITVTRGGMKKTCSVNVETPKLNRTELTMDIDELEFLELSGCSHDVVWSTSDDEVCEVYDGEVIAVGEGTATIRAKVHGVTFKCKVTVADSDDEEDDWDDDFDEYDHDDSDSDDSEFSRNHLS